LRAGSKSYGTLSVWVYGQRATVSAGAGLMRIKQAVWLYLILLIFEGALRKWMLPDLATPLLIVRDPLAFFILFEGFRLRLMPSSPYIVASMMIGLVAIFVAVLFGHGDPYVAVFGARPFLLHFPAMFVMAQVLSRDDILQMGRFILFVAIGMSVLIVIQFFTPQAAFFNRGVGGEGGAGFSGALGYFRPSGTFSFTSGVAQFYSLLASFVLYFWLQPNQVRKSLLLAATFALIIALPFSISRGLVFQCLLTLSFACFVAISRPRIFVRAVMTLLVMTIVALLLSSSDLFQTSLDVMSSRFTVADQVEGGLQGTLVNRYLGGLLAAFSSPGEHPLFGLGIGMGTSVGAKLLSGEAGFLIAEGEWQRQVGELGIFFGILVIGMRSWLTGFAALQAVKAVINGNILPWMLLANAVTLLPQGGWGQPTSLGFSIMSGVLLLASLKRAQVYSSTPIQGAKVHKDLFR
jgi:hypothetical protein